MVSAPSASINPMHTRLISFLTDIENAMAADDPSPSEGSWVNSRTANYNLGLARLLIGVRLPEGKLESRGAVMLQSYQLADGSICLKATLTWTGSESKTTQSIYAKPSTNWSSEARKVAAEWMAGAPAVAETIAMESTSLQSSVSAVV